ncbi:DUF924 domain-containing protein [Roseomonas sp. NAR14]|uniref:DUF924 domain-containing protein n=1 Tax=Roseomonas acroporae TaxID=2937791 RepID=A0A9X1Y4K0_9PROT|nr:DUF924 family protein [Roseomonas acroporae]MCK8783143.1 DUF924 domain-containing protein [Roseomonas acroporae]
MTPESVLHFWFGGEPDRHREIWFRTDPVFDARCRHFGAMADAARSGALAGWTATAKGALALCLLLDQLPRNLYRGNAAAFDADPQARAVARAAVLRHRHDLALRPVERIFLYLPFEHSEAMADQDLSVTLFGGLRDAPGMAAPGGSIEYAWRHHAVIRRFGRFPHRNAVLGRETTPAERAWLARFPLGF